MIKKTFIVSSDKMAENKFDLKMYNDYKLLQIIAKCLNNMNNDNRTPPLVVQKKWLLYMDKTNQKWMSEYLEAGACCLLTE